MKFKARSRNLFWFQLVAILGILQICPWANAEETKLQNSISLAQEILNKNVDAPVFSGRRYCVSGSAYTNALRVEKLLADTIAEQKGRQNDIRDLKPGFDDTKFKARASNTALIIGASSAAAAAILKLGAFSKAAMKKAEVYSADYIEWKFASETGGHLAGSAPLGGAAYQLHRTQAVLYAAEATGIGAGTIALAASAWLSDAFGVEVNPGTIPSVELSADLDTDLKAFYQAQKLLHDEMVLNIAKIESSKNFADKAKAFFFRGNKDAKYLSALLNEAIGQFLVLTAQRQYLEAKYFEIEKGCSAKKARPAMCYPKN
ncbi:MAG TPA: hypothetical protein VJB59_12875 [Bdellovibrionota bacterium]|nr:hypothetical protein [Bdellovibrionota bacterium]